MFCSGKNMVFALFLMVLHCICLPVSTLAQNQSGCVCRCGPVGVRSHRSSCAAGVATMAVQLRFLKPPRVPPIALDNSGTQECVMGNALFSEFISQHVPQINPVQLLCRAGV